jgi:alpha-glucan,water dikinase
MTEKMLTRSGVVLLVETEEKGDAIEISIRMEEEKDCYMHWGVRRRSEGPWQIPPRSAWPPESRAFNQTAVRTPFRGENGKRQIRFSLAWDPHFSLIDFALFFPDENRWDNNQGRNYSIQVPAHEKLRTALGELLEKGVGKNTVVYQNTYALEGDEELAAAVGEEGDHYRVTLVTNISDNLILHWGIAKRSRHDWSLPPSSMRPPGTTVFQEKAAETPFEKRDDYKRIELTIGGEESPAGVVFVLKAIDSNRWIKNRGQNFFVPLASPRGQESAFGHKLPDLAAEIIENEMGDHSWTLMHRFNLCYDILDRAAGDEEALALIYVWLRFSALRQLDWQRNYNTKPRELSHAMDRLSMKLADLYSREPNGRDVIRLILTTMGRGGDGQRVRDEVLNIMHRRHIKEVSGHFLEEWHQKLHNNTTPDDVVICEAYLAFLKGDGNLDAFYRHLEQRGVTKERLESYERPIRSHPDFIPGLKDALIPDFEHFLGILKDVHSGTDLGTAIHTAKDHLEGKSRSEIESVWAHRDDAGAGLEALLNAITRVRTNIGQRIKGGQEGRDLLFLDLALEDFLRVVVERNLHKKLTGQQLTELIATILENLSLTYKGDELAACRREWRRIKEKPAFSKPWSLRAEAVIDRLERVVGDITDHYYGLLQPKAESLGKAFHAEPWTVRLFSEEVVRGRLVFVLSMLVHHIRPILRKSADLGDWQVISRHKAAGRVVVVEALRDIQGKDFEHPTVLVTGKVAGDEEIPQGATAILTPDTTDIVSHVAIRARNAGILFASCFDPEKLEQLKSLEGRHLSLAVSARGEVVFQEGSEEGEDDARQTRAVHLFAPLPRFAAYALTPDAFDEKAVGGKSNNLKRLKENVPEWIGIPPFVAIPFGVFESVMEEKENEAPRKRYEALTRGIDEEGQAEERRRALEEIRKTVLELQAPERLMASLREVMTKGGLPWPEDREKAWTCVKRVWASKWNERAYLSRKAAEIPHRDLHMAVLIQEVVEADYGFVIHTVDPSTGNDQQIYAEVVLGLGETLVGNYPGRAFSFNFGKREKSKAILTYPSKSVGLYGKGLIFRSDSNGEDLARYAGAGLYDSFLLDPPQKNLLDYSAEPLVWEEGFQDTLMETVARIGMTLESLLEKPQDIEGAWCGGRYYVVQTRPQVGIGDE